LICADLFAQQKDGSCLWYGQEIRTLRGELDTASDGHGPSQTNFLFTGSVLENIQIAKPDASREEIYAAAQRLDCLDLILNLPNGFDTMVGEGGDQFVVGTTPARVFPPCLIADPRILILDEATSAVDSVTESRLQTALSNLLHGRTSFVVAHRLSTITKADQILVLEAGRVVERGTHLELLKGDGPYRNLYRRFAASDASDYFEEEEAEGEYVVLSA